MSLFQRLGGSQAISLVVDKFYQFMLDDNRVAHYFASTDMEKQRARQKQFITLVTGGPNQYEGTDMKTAHCKHQIGEFEFDSTWENLGKALDFYNVPEAQKQELKEIFYSVQDDIVNRKNKVEKCPFSNKNQHLIQQSNRVETQEVKQSSIVEPQQEEKSLFEKLGGSQAVKLVVNKFYQIMLADQRVARYFANTDMEKQKNSQVEFLSMVTGGPVVYQGKDMKTAHCPYKISNIEFDATWQNLEQTLKHFSVPLQLVSQIKDIFYSVESQIVNCENQPSIEVTTSQKCQQQQNTQHIPITLKQTTNFVKDMSVGDEKVQPKSNSTGCPFKHLQNLSAEQKRRIKLQVMQKEQRQKKQKYKKLTNCPYQKTYY